MPRKPPPGPSRLSQILKHLQREPVPTLPALRTLRLTYAIRNDHFGARHFVKEDLPRIAYANPKLDIGLDRKRKGIEDTLVPEMLLEFRDGSQHKINMEKKWSSNILVELLEAHRNRGSKKGDSTVSSVEEQRALPPEPKRTTTHNVSN